MKLSVGQKILLKNIVVIIALLAIGLLYYESTDRMLTAYFWRQHTYQVKATISDLLANLNDAELAERGFLITKNTVNLNPYDTDLTKVNNEIQKIRRLTDDNPIQQHQLDILEPLVQTKLTMLTNALKSTNPAEAIAPIDDNDKIMTQIRSSIALMQSEEDSLLATRIQQSNDFSKITQMLIIVGTISIIIFVVIADFIFSRNIAVPLRRMTESAKKIAQGEFDNTFTQYERADEVGVLSKVLFNVSHLLQKFAHAANKISQGDLTIKIVPISEKDLLGTALARMLRNLRDFTQDNQKAVQQLNESVHDIFTSVSQLVSAGNETAAAVSETTSTIEEVRQISEISSEKAKSVSDGAQLSARTYESGKKATEESNEGILHIRDQMTSIAESMMQLSEQTAGINSIVETVEDLAQQSNLLSVNAAIEAEKAGEQGRGFRIVAQEIKRLAKQSKQATSRVREILVDVQKATSSAVLATEKGNKIAETGVKKSEEAGESIFNLSNSIVNASEAAIQISASSKQQLIGMEQAAIAMENIKTASTQNVESAKQLEDAAQQLKEIGEILQKLVNKYRVMAAD